MKYQPLVERWRPVVAKYFPPELVDKALWVIQYESGGNSKATGDGGVARGLFQIQDNRAFSNRPDAAYLDDPENNIRYAAEKLGGSSGNFSAWGEGVLYEGKPFGALGNHPYTEPINARASTSTGVKPVAEPKTPTQEKKPVGSVFPKNTVSRIATKYLEDTVVKGRGIKAPVGSSKTYDVYTPTGDFAKDTAGYAKQMQQAEDELDRLMGESGDALIRNDNQGVVLNSDESINIPATKILQRYLNAASRLDNLYLTKKAAVGEQSDSANAYVKSELDKQARDKGALDDYNKRIGNLIALEDLPMARAQGLAETLSAVNKSNAEAKKGKFLAPKQYFSNPQLTDMAPFAKAIKDTIPGTAPSASAGGLGATAPPMEDAVDDETYGLGGPITSGGLPLPTGEAGATAVGTLPNGVGAGVAQSSMGIQDAQAAVQAIIAQIIGQNRKRPGQVIGSGPLGMPAASRGAQLTPGTKTHTLGPAARGGY